MPLTFAKPDRLTFAGAVRLSLALGSVTDPPPLRVSPAVVLLAVPAVEEITPSAVPKLRFVLIVPAVVLSPLPPCTPPAIVLSPLPDCCAAPAAAAPAADKPETPGK